MPEFLVRLIEPAQGVAERRVQAADAAGVAQALGVRPTAVLSVRPLVPRAAAWARRPRALPLRLLCQELAVLLDAGIPLLEALSTLREKEAEGSALARAIDALVLSLREGCSLSDAMRAQAEAFGPLLIAVVAASEKSGQLAAALREQARFLAWREGLRSRLVSAAIYPAMLLGAGGLVVLFLLLYVMPRFAGVLDGLNAELPWASRALLGLGTAAAAHPERVGLGLGALALAVTLVALHAPTRAALSAALQGLLWRLPGLGERLRTLALAQCYRTLGLLLAAGVPIVPALGLVSGVVGPRFADALAALREDVRTGQRLSEALDAHHLATPVARRMVRVGERSGSLATMLERAAAFHDEELAQLSELVARTINPVLMLLMGVLIGGIVVLMYLPIFALVESVQ